jgi:hypothetical protein
LSCYQSACTWLGRMPSRLISSSSWPSSTCWNPSHTSQ